jgi:hypothetical protein
VTYLDLYGRVPIGVFLTGIMDGIDEFAGGGVVLVENL